MGRWGQALFDSCPPILHALPPERGGLEAVTGMLAPDPVPWNPDLFRIQEETGHALQLVAFVHFRRAVRGRAHRVWGRGVAVAGR